jgi:hypothetical protein
MRPKSHASARVRRGMSSTRVPVMTRIRFVEDRVVDNISMRELTESENLLFGRTFGLVTDIYTGPDGHLCVVSTSHGAVYLVSRRN